MPKTTTWMDNNRTVVERGPRSETWMLH